MKNPLIRYISIPLILLVIYLAGIFTSDITISFVCIAVLVVMSLIISFWNWS